METPKLEKPRFGCPGFFLALATILYVALMFSFAGRGKASAIVVYVCLGGIALVPPIGVIIAFRRWRRLSICSKLMTYALIVVGLWMWVALVPAL